MVATTVKGTQITAVEGVPGNAPLAYRLNAELKRSVGYIPAATTSIDEQDDVMLITLVPSNAIVDQVTVLNDDLDSNGTPALDVDIGVYYSGLGGTQTHAGNTSGTEIDVDLFASAVTTLQAANVTPADVTYEAQSITNYGTELWEAAGLTSDPGG